MIRLNWVSKSEKWLRVITIACGVFIAAIGSLLKVEASAISIYMAWGEKSFASEFVRLILQANANNAWWWIPALTFVAGVTSFFRSQFGDKHKWSCVTVLLEEYRKSVFDDRPDFEKRAKHWDRVTLFKYTKPRFAFCRWPWIGWMVPVARTGHATVSRKIPRFKSNLDDPSKSEGIAGTTFANNAQVPGYNLPEIDDSSSQQDKEQYAKYGQVPLSWVEERIKKGEKCRSRSLLGVPIEVKGSQWGAIVIDSIDPAKLSIDDEQSREEFRILSRLLAKLLEDG